MKYIGLHIQQARNNFRSVLLLCLFPCLVILAALLFSMLLVFFSGANCWANMAHVWKMSWLIFLCLGPLMLFGVAIWFMLHPQQIRDNFLWIPCLVIILTFLFSALAGLFTSLVMFFMSYNHWVQSLPIFQQLVPHLLVGTMVWFIIAYFVNTAIIRKATGAHSMERKKNKRVYNLVENLCISQGMAIPKIDLIEDDSLNAFASGIDNHTYTVSLSRGIINELSDEELEGVIAHELSHIRNGDTRLLIVSVVFVGLFAMARQIALHYLLGTPRRGRYKGRSGGIKGRAIMVTLIALLVATIGYIFSSLMRFALSRSREYMADAGSAEMTHRPQALASALRKISQKPYIASVTGGSIGLFFDAAPLFIEDPTKEPLLSSDKDSDEEDFFELFDRVLALFATHPPITKRITILEQF